jgi:putative transposase
MPSYPERPSLTYRFCIVLSSFLQADGLPFADVVSEEQIEQAFAAEQVSFGQEKDAVYTPAVTLWAFLSQILFKGEQRSCLAAVSRVCVLLVALSREPCAKNSGAYCRARAKIPVAVVRRLAVEVAAAAEQRIPQDWLWRGRHVKLVDGTTLSMPDTAANQAAYPQPASQQPGLGFPLARLVLLFSLATAMISDLEIGPYLGKETGETALLRQMLPRLCPGDLLLADRYYCSYFLIALLVEHGVDFVVRLHQRRRCDFRRGQRLGLNDHLVEWLRPAKPDWMDGQTYERMPASIRVREVQVRVNQPGFRVDSLVVVTTLTDAESFSKDAIAELYHKRWLVELDIRALKITLGIDILRCKTPDMVRKEVWTAVLAYNLIRQTMLQGAEQEQVSPRELSFTHALDTVASSWTVVLVMIPGNQPTFMKAMLAGLSGQCVGDRPNRIEPRAIKRRPKPHDLLTQPRAEARAELLAGKP